MIYRKTFKYALYVLGAYVILCGALYLGFKALIDARTNEKTSYSTSQTWKGLYKDGMETMAFRPCGTEEWWTTAGDRSAIYRVIEPNGQPPSRGASTTIYVEVQAKLSEEGRYGHLAAYKHELAIEQVLVAQKEIPADCR